MKRIKPTPFPGSPGVDWPRHAVASVECRKRDLVIRITNWWSDKEEPAFDVEVYIGGVYDFNESQSFTRNAGLTAEGKPSPTSGLTKKQAKAAVIAFAQKQVEKLL